MEAAILIYSVLAVILLWSWLVLQEGFANLSSSALSINKEYSSYNQEIRAVNKVIREVSLSNRGYLALTPFLISIASSTPPDIKINSLTLDRQSNSLIIIGTAETRPALLRYQEQIKSVDWLSPADSPLSQLWQKENINFQFDLKLNKFPPLPQ